MTKVYRRAHGFPAVIWCCIEISPTETTEEPDYFAFYTRSPKLADCRGKVLLDTGDDMVKKLGTYTGKAKKLTKVAGAIRCRRLGVLSQRRIWPVLLYHFEVAADVLRFRGGYAWPIPTM